MKFYLVLGVLVLLVVGVIADSTKGNDPRWVRDDNCLERKIDYPCFVYRLEPKDLIAQFIHLDFRQNAIHSYGFIKPGSVVIYSPVLPRGPVFMDILVREKPNVSPGDFTSVVVREDSLPRLPQ